MNSPFKIFNEEKNYGVLSSNFDLQSKLKRFFELKDIEFLWDINTSRQKLTHALRNTKSINLRYLKTKPLPTNTEYNKVLDVIDNPLIRIPLFQESYKWIESEFQKYNTKIEIGRIFFSLHLPHTKIDEHIDTGPYFEYFDRFHFCIDTNDQNINYIRNEPIIFKSGFLYWFNNLVPHYLENNSNQGRINLIADVRVG